MCWTSMSSAVCDPPTVPSRFCSTKRTRFLSMGGHVETQSEPMHLLNCAGSCGQTGEHFTRVLCAGEIRLEHQRSLERTTPQLDLPGLHVGEAEMILGHGITWIGLGAAQQRRHCGRWQVLLVVRPPKSVEHLRGVWKGVRRELRQLQRPVEVLA